MKAQAQAQVITGDLACVAGPQFYGGPLLFEQFSLMSSIITGILSSTVGLLANKVRDSAAAELKDGDFTDSKIREFVVRELNDIKTKLDGLDALSLKELKYSYVGLKEGVNFIYVFLYNSNELDQEAATRTQLKKTVLRYQGCRVVLSLTS